MTLLSLFANRPGRFESLLAPHVEPLYRFAYRLTGNRPDAQDLVQDLLTRLYPRTDELRQVAELRPWLARALYNRFVDQLRRRQTDALGAADPNEESLYAAADHGPGPEQETERGLLQRRIAVALSRLNPDQRTIVALHDMEGYTLAELETVLETPIGTLKSRLHRARAALPDLLDMEPFVARPRVEEREETQ